MHSSLGCEFFFRLSRFRQSCPFLSVVNYSSPYLTISHGSCVVLESLGRQLYKCVYNFYVVFMEFKPSKRRGKSTTNLPKLGYLESACNIPHYIIVCVAIFTCGEGLPKLLPNITCLKHKIAVKQIYLLCSLYSINIQIHNKIIIPY